MKGDEIGEACGMHGGDKRSMQDFGGKPEAKRPLGVPSRRWKYNFNADV